MRLLFKKKPSFLIIHLLTLLPLFINFFNGLYETKIILRISGFPKLKLLRKIIWKISSKNIFKVTLSIRRFKKTINS